MDVQKLESVNPTLAHEINNFAASVPPDAKMGLGRLENVVQRYEYLSPDAANLILDPNSFEHEVEQIYASKVPFWIALRNVTSILPLLATWFTLFLASNAYIAYINSPEGKNSQTSFFVLWQNGFFGRTYSFSVAAIIDVVLLAIFLYLTVSVQRREQKAQSQATAFANNLQAISTRLVGFIAEKGSMALPPGANVQTVAEAVNRASAQAIQASRQIADDARKHIDDAEKRVDALVNQLSQRLANIQTQMDDLAKATNSLGASATTISDGATKLAGSAGQYIAAGQAIQQHLSTLNQTETQLTQHMSTIGSSVSTAVNGFTSATQEVQKLSGLVDQASRHVAGATGSLQATGQTLYDTAQELSRSGRAIEDASHQFEQALRVAGYNARSGGGGSLFDWMLRRGSKRRSQKGGRP